jgi:hypothetical protein
MVDRFDNKNLFIRKGIFMSRKSKYSGEELTEQDKLKIKMKDIEAENERLKAENAFLIVNLLLKKLIRNG